ncbi:MAG: hypothetical protein A2992_09005 [Elusimicrobia bacterium RIFCSPLOWO2_01_FULL_59_12]|nr:MAG: hypothetical protein A2992_09005 [Elusimicrobia bacterium RIFCSPLOWO2_01_FULL_59_12]
MENIRKVAATLSKDGDTAIERAHDVAETAWKKGRETFKELRGQGQDAIDQAQKSVQEVWHDTQKLVQKHPGKTVGLALLIGVIIGGALIAMRNNE